MPVFNQSRSRIIRIIFLAAFLVLAAQIFHLQVISREYKKQADINAIFAKRVYPSRGIIFDRKNKAFRPSVFEELLTPQKYARMEENMWRFSNGFFLQPRPVRSYPYNAAAHILGYINEVDTSIINKSNGYYLPGDYSGRTGLEQYYEKVLMGERGTELWIKDNFNRLVGHYQNGAFDTPAVAGRNLRTYIDVDVQQLAEKLLTNKI